MNKQVLRILEIYICLPCGLADDTSPIKKVSLSLKCLPYCLGVDDMTVYRP